MGIENGLGGLTTDNSAEYYWKFFKGALKEAPKIGPARHGMERVKMYARFRSYFKH